MPKSPWISSMSWMIREIKIKTTRRCHYIPVRTAKGIIVMVPNAGKDMEKLKYSYLSNGNVKFNYCE